MDIIGGTIISFENGENGYQPTIVILTKKGDKYLIVGSPERRFLVTLVNENQIEK